MEQFRSFLSLFPIIILFAMCRSNAATYIWDPQGGGMWHDLNDKANYKNSPANPPGQGDRILFDGTNDKNAIHENGVLSVGEFDINSGYTGTVKIRNALKIGNPNQFTISHWNGQNVTLANTAYIDIHKSDILILDGAQISFESHANPPNNFVGTIYIKENSELHLNYKNGDTQLIANIILMEDKPILEFDTGTKHVNMLSGGVQKGIIQFINATNGKITFETDILANNKTILSSIGIYVSNSTDCSVVLDNDISSSGVAIIDGAIFLNGTGNSLDHKSGNWQISEGKFWDNATYRLLDSGTMEFTEGVSFTLDGALELDYDGWDAFAIVGDGIFGAAGATDPKGHLLFRAPQTPSINSGRYVVWIGDVDFNGGTVTMREYFEDNDSNHSNMHISGDLKFGEDKVDFYYRSHGTETSQAPNTEFFYVDGMLTGNFDKFYNNVNNPLANTHDYDWDSATYETFWTSVK